MSNSSRNFFKTEDCENTVKRKRSSGDIQIASKKSKPSEMTDTTNQRRPNFSALAPASNGVNMSTSVKPGVTKKLVIKNFKGKKNLCAIICRVKSIAWIHNLKANW